MQDDCVKNQYDCMRVIDIQANCVRVSDDCIINIWDVCMEVINPHLPMAILLLLLSDHYF